MSNYGMPKILPAFSEANPEAPMTETTNDADEVPIDRVRGALARAECELDCVQQEINKHVIAKHRALAALTAANARIEALEKENFDLTCQRNAAWSELEERGDCN